MLMDSHLMGFRVGYRLEACSYVFDVFACGCKLVYWCARGPKGQKKVLGALAVAAQDVLVVRKT